MSRPVVVMLLTRHPYAHKSGRGFTLPQRIAQVRRSFDVRLVAFGKPVGAAIDEGITFLPLASPLAALANAVRLWGKPLQTWLYYSAASRRAIEALMAETKAAALYVDMIRLAPFAERMPGGAALVLDYDDLLSQRYRQAASAKGYDVMGFLAGQVGVLARLARVASRPLLAWEARRCAAYEQALYARADVALVVSNREGEAMRAAGARVLVIPPLIAPRADTPPPGARLIFLGNMHYAENIAMLRALAEAAAALADSGAWPEGAVVEAVGDHAPELPERVGTQHIKFLGRIADLGDLAGAGVFLAPVAGGSGVKLKVLDGMALGCPVVATPKALEGLSARANRDVMVGIDAKAVLSVALALRTRPRLKAMLAARGRAYLERAHAPSAGDALADAIAAAIARRHDTL